MAEVRDGETLRLDDGRMLRLIGALAPRASDVGAPSGSWPPENEARAALAALVEGRTITLWHDATRRDRYGQILAQATIGSGADTVWLQGALVTRGMARAYGRPGMDTCTEALVRLERSARDGAIGLWSNAAYRVRDAGDRRRSASRDWIVSSRQRHSASRLARTKRGLCLPCIAPQPRWIICVRGGGASARRASRRRHASRVRWRGAV